MVEARGIEPLSEREPTKTSPSAVYDLNFASSPTTDHLLSCYLDKFPLISPRIETRVSRCCDTPHPLRRSRG